jgi:hypothetical protein
MLRLRFTPALHDGWGPPALHDGGGALVHKAIRYFDITSKIPLAKIPKPAYHCI